MSRKRGSLRYFYLSDIFLVCGAHSMAQVHGAFTILPLMGQHSNSGLLLAACSTARGYKRCEHMRGAWASLLVLMRFKVWQMGRGARVRHCKHCDLEHELYCCSKCGSFLSCHTSSYSNHYTDMDNVSSAHQHIICKKCGRDNMWYCTDGDVMWRIA